MKALFLDMDGVMNSGEFFERTKGDREGIVFMGDMDHFMMMIDPKAIARLQRIVDAADCDIVISSTWRKLFQASTKIAKMLALKGLKSYRRVIDSTPIMHGEPRGHEIKAWLDEHAELVKIGAAQPIESFVVLDDDSDMDGVEDNFVQTDNSKGLQDEQVDQAIAILNGTTRSHSAV